MLSNVCRQNSISPGYGLLEFLTLKIGLEVFLNFFHVYIYKMNNVNLADAENAFSSCRISLTILKISKLNQCCICDNTCNF